MTKYTKPKVLFLDIETAPIEAHVWRLFDQNVGLNQIVHDWSILSWAAKWQGSSKVLYEDVSGQKNKRDDSKIVKSIWELIDEAQIIVGQNSNAFDLKKLNARFILNGLNPPSSYQKIDTKVMAKKVFGFTSNRLEYMADKLCTKYKKLKHKNFVGHELWVECLRGNPKAWKEMEKYNKHDVLALEELYDKLIAWDNPVNFNVFHKMHSSVCVCGGTKFKENGIDYQKTGAFKRYRCLNKKCGKNFTVKDNYLSRKKKREMFR
jgi:DNA polymerase III epsilon subunit-like protein